jgi:hypothetical protein
MIEVEVELPPGVDLATAETVIEEVCTAENLDAILKSTLITYSGSTHWHFKKGKARGIVEVTLWPQERRLWFSMHHNRSAGWIRLAMERLKGAIEQRLRENE